MLTILLRTLFTLYVDKLGSGGLNAEGIVVNSCVSVFIVVAIDESLVVPEYADTKGAIADPLKLFPFPGNASAACNEEKSF